MCAKCRKSFHLKCVGLSVAQYKALRDFAGAEWFCPACRNSPFDLEQSSINPALNLILARLSAILRLVGGQIDVTRSLCRALNDSNRRSSSCMPDPRPSLPATVNEAKNFEDALNNIQFEFSNVFGSFIADGVDISDTKRDRTSSLSSSNVTSSRSGKKMRVDVSVDTSDIPNVTISSISGDASTSIPVENGCKTSIADTNATPTLTVPKSTSGLGHATVLSVTTAKTATSTTAASNAPKNSSTVIKTSTTTTASSTTNASTTSSPSIISNATNATTAVTISNETITVPNPTTAKPFLHTATPANANLICTSSAVAMPPHPPSSAVHTRTIDRSTQTIVSSPMPKRSAQSLPQYPAIVSAASASMNHTTITTTSTTIATTPFIQRPVPPSSRLLVPSVPFTHISQPIPCPVDRPAVYIPTSGENTTSNSLAQESNINTRISLAVAAKTPSAMTLSNNSRNWYYLTKFQPHETEANIINYIAHHAHCVPTQITCHRLIRNGEDRPLSFLSFKLNVPLNIEQTLLTDGFWPNGVSMTPFLDRRSNSNKPIGTQKQNRLNHPIVGNQPTPSPRLQDAPRFQPPRPTTVPGLRQEILRLQGPKSTPALQQRQTRPPFPPLPKIRATLV